MDHENPSEDEEYTIVKVKKTPPMVKLVKKLSKDYSAIISREELAKHVGLTWGGNGIGDRWASKMFNYTVVYGGKKTPKTYSDEIMDSIPEDVLKDFSKSHNGAGIIGIFVHSKKENKDSSRIICKAIRQKMIKKHCVWCDTGSGVIPDHKNDFYNDPRVLSVDTQKYSDFQPLCNHCNLQKRQINKTEKEKSKLYSAKQIGAFKAYSFEFPWEKKAFDPSDVDCKKDTFWYDPAEFMKKISLYSKYRMPVNEMVKRSIPLIN